MYFYSFSFGLSAARALNCDIPLLILMCDGHLFYCIRLVGVSIHAVCYIIPMFDIMFYLSCGRVGRSVLYVEGVRIDTGFDILTLEPSLSSIGRYQTATTNKKIIQSQYIHNTVKRYIVYYSRAHRIQPTH